MVSDQSALPANHPTKAFGRFAPSAIVGLLRNSLSEAFRIYVSGLCFGFMFRDSISGQHFGTAFQDSVMGQCFGFMISGLRLKNVK